jgi:pyrimidine 5'-nucleotidase
MHAQAIEMYHSHGTTLAGLVAAGHKIDYEDWHRKVHTEGLDYSTIQKDNVLRDLLLSLPFKRVVFTNADTKHAHLCLSSLGLDHGIFEAIYDFESLNPPSSHSVTCKPSVKSFDVVLKLMGAKASECIFFDDSSRNIKGAHTAGIKTCHVGPLLDSALCEGADYVLPDLHQLPVVIPGLFEEGECGGEEEEEEMKVDKRVEVTVAAS